MYWVFEWAMACGLIGITAGIVIWLLVGSNRAQTRTAELTWLSRDATILDPEVIGNVVDFSIPKEFLVPALGGSVEVDMNQYIQLPNCHGGILSTIPNAFSDDIEVHAQILEPGWYGDLRVTLRSYAAEAFVVPANLPFVRLMIPDVEHVKVLRLNDQLGG